MPIIKVSLLCRRFYTKGYMYWGKKKVMAVASGKGGVGKSIVVANLGVVLGAKGMRTVLVDADLGAANLHTILGVKSPEKTLRDFVDKTTDSLEHVLITTPYANVRLLSSASDILSLVFPNYKERMRLMRALQKLDADLLIFDIAAGTHQRATDFFAMADTGVIILEPVPTSLENAFSFLKNLLTRALLRYFYHDKEMAALVLDSLDPKKAGTVLSFNELLDICEKKSPAKSFRFVNRYCRDFAGSIWWPTRYRPAGRRRLPKSFAPYSNGCYRSKPEWRAFYRTRRR